jgi:TrmH family RNA methyltransferase
MITSTQNATIKRIRRLRQKKHRLREGAFFVEGLRVVLTALEMDAPVETIVWCDALLQSEIGRKTVATTDFPTVEVSETAFRAIADRDTPTGLAAVIAIDSPEISSLPITPDSVFIALTDIADPGNLGTIIRTADSAGAAGILLIGDTTDPYHPAAVKASMGALFAMPVVSQVSSEETLAWAKQNELAIVATSAQAERVMWDASLKPPLLLAMGSERHGLSAEWQQAADLFVTIPMHGISSSLNLAIATSLLLYEINRQVAQRP